jgi:hypothetical protein
MVPTVFIHSFILWAHQLIAAQLVGQSKLTFALVVAVQLVCQSKLTFALVVAVQLVGQSKLTFALVVAAQLVGLSKLTFALVVAAQLVGQSKLTFALVVAAQSFFSSCSSLSNCLIISAVDLGFKLSFSELYSKVNLQNII